MKKKRIIPRLDVKGTRVVKGVYYEGWRDMGDPAAMAEEYYSQGADEIVYLDIFASLTQRSLSCNVIRKLCEKIYVPLTVGGGLRSIEDIQAALRAGADKVAINTHAIRRPSIIKEASRKFGSQCVVVSIEAKKKLSGYEAYVDHGRNITGVNAIEWAQKAEELGAGEIIISSVDLDGTYKGFDLELIRQVANAVSIPVIAGSGAGSPDNIKEALDSGADGVAVASLLHYKKTTLNQIKDSLIDKGLSIRA